MWDKRGDMIVHEHLPYNAESRMVALTEPITPTSAFYVRNHGTVPRIHKGQWWFRVDGLVDGAVEFGPDELRGQPSREPISGPASGAGAAPAAPVDPGGNAGPGAGTNSATAGAVAGGAIGAGAA